MQCLTVHVVLTAVGGRSVELDFTDALVQLASIPLRVVFTVVAAKDQPNGTDSDSVSEKNSKDHSSLSIIPSTMDSESPSKSTIVHSGHPVKPWEISIRSTSGK